MLVQKAGFQGSNASDKWCGSLAQNFSHTIRANHVARVQMVKTLARLAKASAMVHREDRLAQNWGETKPTTNANAGQDRLARGEHRALLTTHHSVAQAPRPRTSTSRAAPVLH